MTTLLKIILLLFACNLCFAVSFDKQQEEIHKALQAMQLSTKQFLEAQRIQPDVILNTKAMMLKFSQEMLTEIDSAIEESKKTPNAPIISAQLMAEKELITSAVNLGDMPTVKAKCRDFLQRKINGIISETVDAFVSLNGQAHPKKTHEFHQIQTLSSEYSKRKHAFDTITGTSSSPDHALQKDLLP